MSKKSSKKKISYEAILNKDIKVWTWISSISLIIFSLGFGFTLQGGLFLSQSNSFLWYLIAGILLLAIGLPWTIISICFLVSDKKELNKRQHSIKDNIDMISDVIASNIAPKKTDVSGTNYDIVSEILNDRNKK